MAEAGVLHCNWQCVYIMPHSSCPNLYTLTLSPFLLSLSGESNNCLLSDKCQDIWPTCAPRISSGEQMAIHSHVDRTNSSLHISPVLRPSCLGMYVWRTSHTPCPRYCSPYRGTTEVMLHRWAVSVYMCVYITNSTIVCLPDWWW